MKVIIKSRQETWLLLIATLLALLLLTTNAQGAIKPAINAKVGDSCLRNGKIAPGRAIDGTDLVCMKVPFGSSKGELLWWYAKLTPINKFEIIVPIVSRTSDNPNIVASRSADQIGKAIGSALKQEELIKEFSVKNFTGGSGSVARKSFQTYKNRLATSLITSLTLIHGLATSKSTLKLTDSKAIAQLVQEYEAVVVPFNSKYKSIDQVMNDLKNNPKAVNFIGGVVGGVDHMFMVKLLNNFKIDPLEVSYLAHNSGFEILAKANSDKSSVALSSSGDFVNAVAAGKMRVLGIASPKRLAWLKGKTLDQQAIPIIYGNWYGIVVPPLYGEADTENFIHILDVFQNSQIWKKTLADNYWSPGYMGQKDFLLQIDAQIAEANSFVTLLGL